MEEKKKQNTGRKKQTSMKPETEEKKPVTEEAVEESVEEVAVTSTEETEVEAKEVSEDAGNKPPAKGKKGARRTGGNNKALELELEKQKELIEEANDKYKRLLAEFENARNRNEKESKRMYDIGAKEVLEKSEASPQAKESAVVQAEKVENYILYQTNIENLLKAKGFSDCLCCITEQGCSVVVPKSDMEDDSPMIIKDVVFGQTGINFENITITEI